MGDLQTDVWDMHPGDYRPPTAEQQDALRSAWERSPAPEDWVQHINPGKEAPGRTNNCNDCTLDGRGGHSFNAVNDRGTVKYVDGQSGEVGQCPPPWSGDERTTYEIFRVHEEDGDDRRGRGT